MYRPQSAATERLKRLGERAASPASGLVSLDEDHSASDLAQRLASPLSKLLPPSAAEAKKLQKQLMQAGFRSPGATVIYRAIQLATLAGLPAMVALGCALLARPLDAWDTARAWSHQHPEHGPKSSGAPPIRGASSASKRFWITC